MNIIMSWYAPIYDQEPLSQTKTGRDKKTRSSKKSPANRFRYEKLLNEPSSNSGKEAASKIFRKKRRKLTTAEDESNGEDCETDVRSIKSEPPHHLFPSSLYSTPVQRTRQKREIEEEYQSAMEMLEKGLTSKFKLAASSVIGDTSTEVSVENVAGTSKQESECAQEMGVESSPYGQVILKDLEQCLADRAYLTTKSVISDKQTQSTVLDSDEKSKKSRGKKSLQGKEQREENDEKNRKKRFEGARESNIEVKDSQSGTNGWDQRISNKKKPLWKRVASGIRSRLRRRSRSLDKTGKQCLTDECI